MVRFTCAMALFVATLICVNGWIENVWAASFNDQSSQYYLDRAGMFLFLSTLFVGACVAVIVWGKKEWLRHVLMPRRHSHYPEEHS